MKYALFLILAVPVAGQTLSDAMPEPIIVSPPEESTCRRLAESNVAGDEVDLMLLQAAAAGDTRRLRQAIQSGVDINICDSNGPEPPCTWRCSINKRSASTFC